MYLEKEGEECVFRGGLLPPWTLLDLPFSILGGLTYSFLAEYLIEGLGGD